METLLLSTGPKDMQLAADIITAGGLVAFPTETVYGLGGDALNPLAASLIYEAKGRPADNPLIVHIADVGLVQELASNLDASFYALAHRYWPGPLTMVVSKKQIVPGETTGGLPTVALRMPDHPTALALTTVGHTDCSAVCKSVREAESDALGTRRTRSGRANRRDYNGWPFDRWHRINGARPDGTDTRCAAPGPHQPAGHRECARHACVVRSGAL